MKATVLPNMISFEGVLNEKTSFEDLERAFEQYRTNKSDEKIVVDFSGVPHANSSGIVTWLKFLESNRYQVKYINCPVWLVNQFNMINGFFANESYPESIQVPYYCESNDESQTLVGYIGKDIPILPSYSDFELQNRDIDGESFEPDIIAEQYFSFLSSNKDLFQKKL